MWYCKWIFLFKIINGQFYNFLYHINFYIILSEFLHLTRTCLYLLSLCEYFTLLLPLVRDAGHWALIVWTQCGCYGMQPSGVRCVVTGVWLLRPAGRPSVCLSSVSPSVQLHLTADDIDAPTRSQWRTSVLFLHGCSVHICICVKCCGH